MAPPAQEALAEACGNRTHPAPLSGRYVGFEDRARHQPGSTSAVSRIVTRKMKRGVLLNGGRRVLAWSGKRYGRIVKSTCCIVLPEGVLTVSRPAYVPGTQLAPGLTQIW